MPMSAYKKRVSYEILEYDPLLDSCNLDDSDWARIANDIQASYARFDAFVVLHGTDTMAYTASALSFMLEGLGKTVVVTGSQIPLCQPRNDGVDNLLGAITVAGHFRIPEVCLFFHNNLFRGNRSTKVDASQLDAFGSPNMPPLCKAGIGFDVAWHLVHHSDHHGGGDLAVKTGYCSEVAVLTLFPGLQPAAIRAQLAPPLRGVVLQTFGAGNAPDQNEASEEKRSEEKQREAMRSEEKQREAKRSEGETTRDCEERFSGKC